MHAIVVNVTINDREAATDHLRNEVVPGVKQAPGLIAAYWVRIDGKGRSMGIFETEDAAHAYLAVELTSLDRESGHSTVDARDASVSLARRDGEWVIMTAALKEMPGRPSMKLKADRP